MNVAEEAHDVRGPGEQRHVTLNENAVETVILQKPGSAQRASQTFPSVASVRRFRSTSSKIICPGGRWNQLRPLLSSRLPLPGISRAQPLVMISRGQKSFG